MGFSPQTKGRCWIGTVHISNMEKAGIAVCVSNNGCYHAHIACYGNTTTLKKVSDILFQSHIEPQLGGKEQLKAYLLKEGEYAEKGEMVLYAKNIEAVQDVQGKRSDLDEIEEMLNNGATPKEIFQTSLRFRKYEKMIKAEYLERKITSIPLVKDMWNEYHFGASGSGKTYTYIKLCEKYSPEEVYLCNDYANSASSSGGFDFYSDNPAKILVLDEFRGNIPYNQLLSMLDVYSRNQQHCRYQNTYCLWTSVIICSIYPPEEVYEFMVNEGNRKVDTLRQFIRRLNLIVYHYVNSDGEYKTFEMPANQYTSSFEMIEKVRQRELETNSDSLKIRLGDPIYMGKIKTKGGYYEN